MEEAQGSCGSQSPAPRHAREELVCAKHVTGATAVQRRARGSLATSVVTPHRTRRRLGTGRSWGTGLPGRSFQKHTMCRVL